jgi:glutaredoxin 3
MRAVRIYTTSWCGYCYRAKRHLKKRGVEFTEIKVDGDWDARRWLREVSGQRTVPQIFFDDESIGGCDELEVLINRGVLDEKLGRAAG